jgi:uncharacterized protein (DUF2267 family)
MTTDLEQLPELPARVDLYSTTTGRGWGYTADQMREYGEACAAQFRAELDRIEELGTPWVPELLEWLGKHDCCPELPFTDYELIEALEARFGEAALSQPAGVAEPNGKLVGWWNGIKPDVTERSPYGPSVRWGADAEDRAHDIPLYDGYNPVHFTKPTLPSVEAFASAVWRDWMTNEQADKLGAELHAWLRAHIAAAPAASGGDGDMCPNCVTPWKCNGPHEAPSGASVSERARELLADEYRKAGMGHDLADAVQRGAFCSAATEAAIDAIERALSSPRQEGEAAAWNIPCGACDCGIYDAQALAAFNGEIPKCKNHDRQCVGAVHAMQATHPSTAASTQGLREYITRLKEAHKHAATYSLTEYEKGWTRRGKVIADELESLLTSPTTGADGGGE